MMQEQISFELLYSEDKGTALSVFLVWVQDFLEGMGVPCVDVDPDKANSFICNLRRDDFPANGGFEKASPFKKAANIYVWLLAINPFYGLPGEHIGADLAEMKHSTAAVIGFTLVQECLHGAEYKKGDETVVLENPVRVSKHFFKDFVEASRGITPADHFKVFSILFESLAYEANPGSSFKRVV